MGTALVDRLAAVSASERTTPRHVRFPSLVEGPVLLDEAFHQAIGRFRMADSFGGDNEETEASEEAATEDSADDTGGGTGESGSGDGPEGEAYTFSGSGLSKSETAHLEGDYTITFSVSGNTLMDMESNFMGTLTNVDDDLDIHLLVNEIATETSGTTNVYGLDGDYYVDVVADGDWSFEFTPQ